MNTRRRCCHSRSPELQGRLVQTHRGFNGECQRESSSATPRVSLASRSSRGRAALGFQTTAGIALLSARLYYLGEPVDLLSEPKSILSSCNEFPRGSVTARLYEETDDIYSQEIAFCSLSPRQFGANARFACFRIPPYFQLTLSLFSHFSKLRFPPIFLRKKSALFRGTRKLSRSIRVRSSVFSFGLDNRPLLSVLDYKIHVLRFTHIRSTEWSDRRQHTLFLRAKMKLLASQIKNALHARQTVPICYFRNSASMAALRNRDWSFAGNSACFRRCDVSISARDFPMAEKFERSSVLERAPRALSIRNGGTNDSWLFPRLATNIILRYAVTTFPQSADTVDHSGIAKIDRNAHSRARLRLYTCTLIPLWRKWNKKRTHIKRNGKTTNCSALVSRQRVSRCACDIEYRAVHPPASLRVRCTYKFDDLTVSRHRRCSRISVL